MADNTTGISSRGVIERLVLLLSDALDGVAETRHSSSHKVAHELRKQLRHEMSEIDGGELAALMLDPAVEIRSIAQEEYMRRRKKNKGLI